MVIVPGVVVLGEVVPGVVVLELFNGYVCLLTSRSYMTDFVLLGVVSSKSLLYEHLQGSTTENLSWSTRHVRDVVWLHVVPGDVKPQP